MFKIFVFLAVSAIFMVGPCYGNKHPPRPQPQQRLPRYREPEGDCRTVSCPANTRCIIISDPCFELPCLDSTVCVPIRKVQPILTCDNVNCPPGTHCIPSAQSACTNGAYCPPPPAPVCQHAAMRNNNNAHHRKG